MRVRSCGMRRPYRSLVFLLAIALSVTVGGSAVADHCPPIDNPDPIPGQNTEYCHSPTPAPTPQPTPAPEPTEAPPPEETPPPAAPEATAAPAAPTTPRSVEPTPFPIEVEPSGEPEVVVPGAVFEDLEEGSLTDDATEPAASGMQLTFVFLAGLIIGALLGRASWGLSRRRRRQQIFG